MHSYYSIKDHSNIIPVIIRFKHRTYILYGTFSVPFEILFSKGFVCLIVLLYIAEKLTNWDLWQVQFATSCGQTYHRYQKVQIDSVTVRAEKAAAMAPTMMIEVWTDRVSAEENSWNLFAKRLVTILPYLSFLDESLCESTAGSAWKDFKGCWDSRVQLCILLSALALRSINLTSLNYTPREFMNSIGWACLYLTARISVVPLPSWRTTWHKEIHTYWEYIQGSIIQWNNERKTKIKG